MDRPHRFGRHARVVAALAALLAVGLTPGCALLSRERPPGTHAPEARRAAERPRPIEARATPVVRDTVRAARGATRYTRHARVTLASMVARDTLLARAAVRRCSGRALLPDAENTCDAVQSLLERTRAALGRGDIGQARSYARDARQLAGALDAVDPAPGVPGARHSRAHHPRREPAPTAAR